MPTSSENIVAQINSNVFFKEFTFSKNDFKALDTKQRLELADNVVWMDDFLFVYQIKEKEPNAGDEKKWFENKVLNKAVKQIKSTLKYISQYPEIYIENEKGHILDITKAKENTEVKKIIVYSTDDSFSEPLRNQKFYESSEVGLIHLFHAEDYYWICKYLFTPSEVNEYLNFREELYLFGKERSNALPEQYFLGHFLETPDGNHFDAKYINNVKNFEPNTEAFDITRLLDKFCDNAKLLSHQTEYYPILKELAKLNRGELIEFKKRLTLCVEKCKSESMVLPYRIFLPRTDCGFVFISLHSSEAKFWKNALHNFTMAHKYESKARKCIGLVIYPDKEQREYFEAVWQFMDEEWVYDSDIEMKLAESYPFRKTKNILIENRYKHK